MGYLQPLGTRQSILPSRGMMSELVIACRATELHHHKLLNATRSFFFFFFFFFFFNYFFIFVI